MLKSGDLAPEGICLAHQELLGQECIGIGIQGSKVCFVGVEPHLRFAEQREWEQLKTDVIHCSASGVDGTTHFQKILEMRKKILEMSVSILGCLTVEQTCLNHVHQPRLELKAIIALVIVQSSRDVATGQG